MRIPPAAIMMIYFRAKNCANAEAWVMFRCGPTLPHTGPASFFIRAQTLWIPLTRAHTQTHSMVVGVPASRAGPPDNGGSLFIYPSMRADTTDRLPFIGKSFLIPQMSGALNRRGHRVSLRTRAIELRHWEGGGRVVRSVFRTFRLIIVAIGYILCIQESRVVV